jgi:phospho-2-dehydro-3-deoxyheptonate aldolase
MNWKNNDTLSIVDDENIESIEPIITPRELIETFPLDNKTATFIKESRKKVRDIVDFKEKQTKPLVIV